MNRQHRVRLIQIRSDQEVARSEASCFEKRCQLAPGELKVTNVLNEDLNHSILDDADAVLIGGAGAYSVTETYPWTAALVDLVEEIDRRELPLFGSCWGHQFIAFAFGGKVINDPTKSEMGCRDVHLTDAGTNDVVLGQLPRTFPTNMGHQDRVSVLPAGAIELATNETAPYQAFRLADKPIYGTQFHSELDSETERYRLIRYRDHYPEMTSQETFDQVLDSLRPTEEVESLLKHFLDTFCRE